MRVGFAVLVALAVLLPAVRAEADPGDVAWQRFDFPGDWRERNTQDKAIAVSPDGGMMYVAGGHDHRYWVVAFGTQHGGIHWISELRWGRPVDIAIAPDGETVYTTGVVYSRSTSVDVLTAAFRTSDGAARWVDRFDTPWSGADKGSGLSLTPDGLFVAGESRGEDRTLDGLLIAYEPRTGERRWVRRFDAGGYEAWRSIEAAGGRVAVAGRGTAAVFDAATGARRWALPERGFAARAAVLSPDGAVVYVGAWAPKAEEGWAIAVGAFNGADGSELWRTVHEEPDGWTQRRFQLALAPDATTVYVSGPREALGHWTPDHAGYDVVTFALDASDGAEHWSRLFDRDQNDLSLVMSISADGARLAVAGLISHDPVSEDPDYLTILYDARTGVRLWVAIRPYIVPALWTQDVVRAIAFSSNGERVFVSGEAYAPGFTDSGWLTIAYEA